LPKCKSSANSGASRTVMRVKHAVALSELCGKPDTIRSTMTEFAFLFRGAPSTGSRQQREAQVQKKGNMGRAATLQRGSR
jgi:hypothetical protein